MGAPYNPRKIDERNRKKLQRNLKKVGLLAPITWNRRTGFVVSGHQRLGCLDALEGRPDYELDVAVVDLDEKTEREQNLAFNNHEIQGDWDMDALAELLKTGLELENTGFDFATIQVAFDDPELSQLFAPSEEQAELTAAVTEQQKQADAVKKRREESRKALDSGDDTEAYAVVLFRTRERREDFMRACGASPDDRYIDGERLLTFLSGSGGHVDVEQS